MTAPITCPTCGYTRPTRRNRPPHPTPICRPCRKAERENVALVGGAWRIDPFSRVLRWVEDAA